MSGGGQHAAEFARVDHCGATTIDEHNVDQPCCVYAPASADVRTVSAAAIEAAVADVAKTLKGLRRAARILREGQS